MPGRLGARFAIEALFLIALAVGAAYADLERKWILLVMAGGWLVVALLELTADRIWAEAPPWRRPYYMAAPPPRAEAAGAPPVSPEEQQEAVPEPEPEPEPARVAESEPELPPAEEPEPVPMPVAEPEAATVIVRPAEPPRQPEQAAAGPSEEAAAEELPPPTLEPLETEPKRRWFRRKQHEEPAVEALPPEPPKHVRLLPPSGKPGSAPTELEDTFETTEREEHSRR
jgi:hypothetical protein